MCGTSMYSLLCSYSFFNTATMASVLNQKFV
jgi:hypothetical protein